MTAVSEPLTLEERAHSFDTHEHIGEVRKNLNTIIRELLTRGELHDRSKLAPPEVAGFARSTPGLAKLDYGTAEYDEAKKSLGEALEHHYAKNRHHPEFHRNGVADMNLIDLVELFCDWAAAVKRHNTGNLHKSIEINAERFNLPPMLQSILRNSIDLLE